LGLPLWVLLLRQGLLLLRQELLLLGWPLGEGAHTGLGSTAWPVVHQPAPARRSRSHATVGKRLLS